MAQQAWATSASVSLQCLAVAVSLTPETDLRLTDCRPPEATNKRHTPSPSQIQCNELATKGITGNAKPRLVFIYTRIIVHIWLPFRFALAGNLTGFEKQQLKNKS